MRWYSWRNSAVFALMTACMAIAETHTETFDAEPDWDALNNPSTIEMRRVVQDFGYVKSPEFPNGAIGGMITPDGTPAYCAMPIPESTLDTPLQASGRLTVKAGAGNVLLGFFNKNTINEWRTPNSLVFRINGRGETFHVHTEYATSKWRAGAGIFGRYDAAADRMHPIENTPDRTYRWTLMYDPAGNDGAGCMKATLDDVEAIMNLDPNLRADGAAFNRFGFLNVVKHADGGGSVFISELTVNGRPVDLSADPKWDESGNHASYLSPDTRPRFNVGYHNTQYAGGKAPGEIGGLWFRGDCRYPHTLGYYGAKTVLLTTAKPLRASGKLAFRRGISDSTALFGFFHSSHSVHVNESQKHGLPADFIGFAIDGPSREGFFISPVYRMHGESQGGGRENLPYIYPDGTPHDWSLVFEPDPATGGAALTLTFDDKPPVIVNIPADHVAEGAEFDRLGFVSSWIDGNGQVVYLDDLTYTVNQAD